MERKCIITQRMGVDMAGKIKQEQGGEAAFPWGELPLEVQSSVLSWLPLRPLFRSKRVCKLWNSTISSPSFSHFPSLLPFPTNPPWLIFFTPKRFDFLLAFDFEALSWFKFDVGFVCSTLNSMHASASAPSAQQGFVWCTGAASGFLLLDFRSSLHVCNPLTKSLFRLPPFKSIAVSITQGFSSTHIRSLFPNAEIAECIPTHTHIPGPDSVEGSSANTHSGSNVIQGSSTATHNIFITTFLSTANIRGNAEGADCTMRAHRRSNDYTLIAIGKAKTDLAIESYCADRNLWNVVGSMPISFIIRHDQMMECNGLFYSLLLKPVGMLVVGERDGKGGPIWRIQAMPANYGKEARSLLACQNAIFMVCPADEHNNGFVIWRFQPDSRAWIKMHDMPDYILQDVKSVSPSNWVDCVGVGNFICFRALCSLRVLTYNLCNDVWSWLPEPSHAYDTIFARGIQFEPRLDYRPSL